MEKSKQGMPERFMTNVLVKENKPGEFKIVMFVKSKNDKKYYDMIDSLEAGSEVYINGPYGNWKYIESPGIFHYKPNNCTYNFKRIFMIVENENYLSCLGIIRNEISKENINSCVEIRILYIADCKEDIFDRDRLEFLCDYKLGK